MWVAVAAGTSHSSSAAVTVFESSAGNRTDRIAWEQEVQTWETMDFVGVEEEVPIPTDFYLDEFGVLIDGGPAWGHLSQMFFPMDGSGFGTVGFEPFVDIRFDEPIRALGADHPGGFRFTLFLGEDLVYETGLLGVGNIGNFSGVISEVPFDRVRISDSDGFGVDDLRFGLVVPGPPVAAMLLTFGVSGLRPRRR
jgi:hypothetical protein